MATKNKKDDKENVSDTEGNPVDTFKQSINTESNREKALEKLREDYKKEEERTHSQRRKKEHGE